MIDIDELLVTDEEDLFLMLAEDLKGDNLALDLRDAKQKVSDARAWFYENIEKLKRTVCSNPIVQKELANEKVLTKKELIAAIADAVLLVLTVPTPSLIAVIIYRGGIHTFCEKYTD